MKFNCGPELKPLTDKERAELARWEAAGERWRAKRAHQTKWHLWFAWYPVRVGDRDCRWLEYVERRKEFFSGGTIWPLGLTSWVYYRIPVPAGSCHICDQPESAHDPLCYYVRYSGAPSSKNRVK